MSTDMVTLNIGGVKYHTTISTLTNTEVPNYFTGCLAGELDAVKGQDGSVFIDREVRVAGLVRGATFRLRACAGRVICADSPLATIARCGCPRRASRAGSH